MRAKRRILCVEDDKDTCELLTAMLGFSDLGAVAVSTAAEALRMTGAERFSVYGELPTWMGYPSARRSAGWTGSRPSSSSPAMRMR